jgi:hypothetical protein
VTQIYVNRQKLFLTRDACDLHLNSTWNSLAFCLYGDLPSHHHPYGTRAIELGGPVDSNDILAAAIALTLRYHGTPHSATFYIALPCCSVQVIYPPDSALSLAYWRPRLVHHSIRALVAIRLNHSLSSHDLVELAVSLSVPLDFAAFRCQFRLYGGNI